MIYAPVQDKIHHFMQMLSGCTPTFVMEQGFLYGIDLLSHASFTGEVTIPANEIKRLSAKYMRDAAMALHLLPGQQKREKETC